MLQHLSTTSSRASSRRKLTSAAGPCPGASVASAALDVARTVCRRAERLVVKVATNSEHDLLIVRYLNRLSDLLWLLARYTETQLGEPPSVGG